jgi:hypothetical protein
MPPVNDTVVTLTNRFIRVLEEFLQPDGPLIYQAGFGDESLTPVVDPFHLGPLKWSVTSNLAVPRDTVSMTYIPPSFPEAGPPRPGGVRLSLTRPIDLLTGSGILGIVGTTMVVERFPENVHTFALKATFELPVGPHGPGAQWVVALMARPGALIDDLTVREANNRRITATLQSYYDTSPSNPSPRARLNSPFDLETIVDPGVLPRVTYDELFNPVVTATTERGPVFRMEMRVDRNTDRAEAWLFTSTYTGYRLFRSLFAPFVHPASGAPNVIAVAGAGLAIGTTGGNGPVAVTLRDFRLYGRVGPRQPWSTLRELGAVAVLTPFRIIRNVLVGRPGTDVPPE